MKGLRLGGKEPLGQVLNGDDPNETEYGNGEELRIIRVSFMVSRGKRSQSTVTKRNDSNHRMTSITFVTTSVIVIDKVSYDTSNSLRVVNRHGLCFFHSMSQSRLVPPPSSGSQWTGGSDRRRNLLQQ